MPASLRLCQPQLQTIHLWAEKPAHPVATPRTYLCRHLSTWPLYSNSAYSSFLQHDISFSTEATNIHGWAFQRAQQHLCFEGIWPSHAHHLDETCFDVFSSSPQEVRLINIVRFSKRHRVQCSPSSPVANGHHSVLITVGTVSRL